MDLPWWAHSPSPVTIAFYCVLSLYATKRLLAVRDYRKWKVVNAITDALLFVGFVVLTLDTLWVLASLARFGWMYPDSVMQLIYCVGRNVAGIVFCYLLIGGLWQENIVQFNGWLPLLYWVNGLFLFFWFFFAPSPAYTDWTFAIRHDYSLSVVLQSFGISHIAGKSLVTLIFLSYWTKPKEDVKLAEGK